MNIPTVTILVGDCRETLKTLPSESVQCVVTSPPYYGLRDYGHDGQIGQEQTPAEYVAEMVSVFREVWRVLRSDGTLWLNLGDSYANDAKWGGATGGKHVTALHGESIGRMKRQTGVAPKNLIGIPWRVAFALQDDGWYLRTDIIWAKPNPMPESVQDRCTRSHEYIFHFAKSERYFYDSGAIREQQKQISLERLLRGSSEAMKLVNGAPGQHAHSMHQPRQHSDKQRGHGRRHQGFNDRWDRMSKEEQIAKGSNKRTVWNVATQSYPDAHFATFPDEIPRLCILAGSRHGDMVLDPFGGSGTTGAVAARLGRSAVLCELNPRYASMARRRVSAETPPLFDAADTMPAPEFSIVHSQMTLDWEAA